MEPKFFVVSKNKKGMFKNVLILCLNIDMTNYQCYKLLTTSYFRVSVKITRKKVNSAFIK